MGSGEFCPPHCTEFVPGMMCGLFLTVFDCRWMLEQHRMGIGGILGDEMGLGKTLQVESPNHPKLKS